MRDFNEPCRLTTARKATAAPSALLSTGEDSAMKEYEVLSLTSDGDPVVVCTMMENSMGAAVRQTNNPMGFVQMMDIQVYGIRDESGHINYTTNEDA